MEKQKEKEQGPGWYYFGIELWVAPILAFSPPLFVANNLHGVIEEKITHMSFVSLWVNVSIDDLRSYLKPCSPSTFIIFVWVWLPIPILHLTFLLEFSVWKMKNFFFLHLTATGCFDKKDVIETTVHIIRCGVHVKYENIKIWNKYRIRHDAKNFRKVMILWNIIRWKN